jgi:hypothetical protein
MELSDFVSVSNSRKASHLRQPVADGDAYRAYFTADLMWAMTVTAEIAKGDVPPAQPMRYYWMSHNDRHVRSRLRPDDAAQELLF